jgi:hypothetical protein
MRFRCVALVALWTMFSGPVFGPPASSSPSPHPTPGVSVTAGETPSHAALHPLHRKTPRTSVRR